MRKYTNYSVEITQKKTPYEINSNTIQTQQSQKPSNPLSLSLEKI